MRRGYIPTPEGVRQSCGRSEHAPGHPRRRPHTQDVRSREHPGTSSSDSWLREFWTLCVRDVPNAASPLLSSLCHFLERSLARDTLTFSPIPSELHGRLSGPRGAPLPSASCPQCGLCCFVIHIPWTVSLFSERVNKSTCTFTSLSL